MSWSRFLLTAALLALLAGPAPAGILFKKHTKPDPAQRVPALMLIVKTDPDEHKRAAAATELRQYDTKAFGDIVPILADVLRSDTKASVRLEAAQSLSRIRPVSQEAGLALEQAASNDPALRVRMQARTSLMYYRLSGYHSPKKKESAPPKTISGNTAEPPLAVFPPPPPGNGRLTPIPKPAGSGEPPVEVSKPAPVRPIPDISVAQPLPAGPAKSPLVPTPAPKLETSPPPPAQEQGPPLNPPF
jgi:HEAT repeats